MAVALPTLFLYIGGLLFLIGLILLIVGLARPLPSSSDASYDAKKKEQRNLYIAGGVLLSVGALIGIGVFVSIRSRKSDGKDPTYYAKEIVDDIANNTFGDDTRVVCDLFMNSLNKPGITQDYQRMKQEAKEPYVVDNFCKTTAGSVLGLKSLPRPTS